MVKIKTLDLFRSRVCICSGIPVLTYVVSTSGILQNPRTVESTPKSRVSGLHPDTRVPGALRMNAEGVLVSCQILLIMLAGPPFGIRFTIMLVSLSSLVLDLLLICY